MQQKLRDARAAKGMTQADLAKSMNINVSTIKDYENGTIANFNKGFYNRVLRVLRVSSK
jgi:transcriptional regulator with XRE-family HTH domain